MTGTTGAVLALAVVEVLLLLAIVWTVKSGSPVSGSRDDSSRGNVHQSQHAGIDSAGDTGAARRSGGDPDPSLPDRFDSRPPLMGRWQ